MGRRREGGGHRGGGPPWTSSSGCGCRWGSLPWASLASSLSSSSFPSRASLWDSSPGLSSHLGLSGAFPEVRSSIHAHNRITAETKLWSPSGRCQRVCPLLHLKTPLYQGAPTHRSPKKKKKKKKKKKRCPPDLPRLA